eukprot:1229494-Prymnesium_polylepis.2
MGGCGAPVVFCRHIGAQPGHREIGSQPIRLKPMVGSRILANGPKNGFLRCERLLEVFNHTSRQT